jgi:hypothetical protein
VAALAVEHGVAAPAITSAVSFYDAYRTARLPANLLQAQRDFSCITWHSSECTWESMNTSPHALHIAHQPLAIAGQEAKVAVPLRISPAGHSGYWKGTGTKVVRITPTSAFRFFSFETYQKVRAPTPDRCHATVQHPNGLI